MSATQVETELSSIGTTRTFSIVSSTGSTARVRSGYENNDDDAIPENATEAIPDGGYGWVIVSACSLLTFWFNGWYGAWGVLQTAMLQSKLSDVPTSTISFVGSFSLALVVAFGLLSVRIARTIGARYCALVGIMMAGLGILLASFSTGNLGGIFVTAGAMLGIGCSLLFAMANTVPVQWFSSKLGTANGLVKLGGGVGATVLSLLNQVLLDRVGLEWTFRVLGFICLATGIPAALLIRERVPPSTGPIFDFSLFKNLPYLGLFLAGATGTFALFVPPFFLPLFANSIGLSASTGAGIVAGFNACTALGRVLVGFACDRYGPVNMLFLAMSLNAVSMLAIWPVSSTIVPLVIFAAVNGVANGAYFVAMPTSVTSIVGPGHASVAMSMSITGWTAGYLMGSPIAGMLITATGAGKSTSIGPYRAAIFYAGGIALISGIFVLLARLKLNPQLGKKL